MNINSFLNLFVNKKENKNSTKYLTIKGIKRKQKLYEHILKQVCYKKVPQKIAQYIIRKTLGKHILKQAWDIASKGQKKYGGQKKEYFREALKISWKQTKIHAQK